MYKTLEEVQAALATRLPQDQLKEVNGFSYVPWEVTTRQLTDVFGPFGWSEEITNQQYDTQRGIYIVSRRLTGFATVTEVVDDEGHSYTHAVQITREGVGVGYGDPNNGRTTDTAIKAADSDSFSRAAKKLGDAFGLYLYDRDDPAHRSANVNGNTAATTRPAVTGTVTEAGKLALADGRTLTEKQVSFLQKLGWSVSAIQAMTLSRAKAIMDNREKYVEQTADALPF